ncbi:hypothetical protein A6R68_08611 [Neotoma lepida]|uniref:Uncharacterized protein n=1 Tax=Neotoma lepida TaxID=56216 RepID=A0A1A6G247_NEOLE|nr:hypothetical protein A6R68_08611 [Neotoma lepida]
MSPEKSNSMLSTALSMIVEEPEAHRLPEQDNPLTGGSSCISVQASRRQFGPKGKEEVKIIEHQIQTLRLMSHLATALALTFTSRHAAFVLDEDIFQGRELINRRSLQALMAGLKAYSTWETVSCLQDCRECTGGMVVARELLAQYTKQHKKNPVLGLIQNWTATAGDYCDLIIQVSCEDPPPISAARVTYVLATVTNSPKVVTKKEDFFSAWNSCMHHVTSLSLAHIHRVALEQFSLAVRRCPDREDQALLMKFCLLYGMKLVFQERGWYLEHKYLTPTASRQIRAQAFVSCLCTPEGGTPEVEKKGGKKKRERRGGSAHSQTRLSWGKGPTLTPLAEKPRFRPDLRLLDLCESVKDDALKVISAFNIPHTNLHAPIAGVPNPRAAWAFYPAPKPTLVQEGERSQLSKL